MSNNTKLWIVILIILIILFSGITYFFFDDMIEKFNTSKYVILIGWVATVVGTLVAILTIIFSGHKESLSLSSADKPKTRALLLRLLERVEHDWIKGILENSVHHAALLELGMESQPSQVAQLWGRELELPAQENRLLPAEVTIGQVFQKEAARLLLILGEPGSGKTTTLLQLAQELIGQARNDEQQPIPVVFNLSSWAEKRLPLLEWLVKELSSKYQIPPELGNEWLRQQWLLPLLDGLDEVQAAVREECVQAINTFAQGAGVTGLVVCCRRAEYEELKTHLQLNAAISLQPLEPAQINYYLARGGEQLAGLRSLLKDDAEMRELAQSPLMLSIMSLAYQGVPVSEVTPTSPSQQFDKQNQLFDRYVEKMFTRRKEPAIYPQAQVIKGLSWLASQMQQRGKTVFLLEEIQPNWLPTQLGYRLLVVLLAGLLGLLGVLNGVQFLDILLISLGGVLVFAFVSNDIETMETLGWSWSKIQLKPLIKYLLHSLGYGLLFTLPFTLLNQSLLHGIFDSLFISLSVGLFIGLFIGLPYSLLQAGLKNQIPDTKTVVNQGITSSLNNAQYFCLPFGTIVSILWWVVFTATGLLTANMYSIFSIWVWFVTFGFWWLGGQAAFYHYTLRLILILERYTPWNYVRFLDYAARLILLRKVGGGYMFIHRLLLEHLAEKGGRS